ncbi:hypothetical protein Tco_0896730 [Tanacetum coccineum]
MNLGSCLRWQQSVDYPHIHAFAPNSGIYVQCQEWFHKDEIFIGDDVCRTQRSKPRSLMLKMEFSSDEKITFRPELGIRPQRRNPSSSKLVPKVVPLAVKTATSRQELELLFHHHIAMLRTTEMSINFDTEHHLTKDILSQTDCKTILTKLRTTFENAFNLEFKERMQKYTRFDAQSFKDAVIFVHTQEDHSNPIPALNVDSLKVDLVFIQNTCFEKDDSNSETASSKSVKESSLDSAIKDVHAIKYKMSKAKERCMAYFLSLHSHLQVLSKEDLKGTRIEHGFKRAFMSLFGQDADTFTSTMLLNVDQLQKQLDKDKFQEDGSMESFLVYDRRVNKRQMQTQKSKIDTSEAVDDDLVVTESNETESEVQDDNSRSGNDTDADDADIRPIYDEEPMAKVQLTAECNIFAIGQQHTEQPEIINEGRVDQYPEQCQVKSPMLDSSPDNQTTDYSKQSLESENILLKKTVAQFQKDFSRMEAHCIALELKYQNQALKSGQHGQILNETSNKAKIKKEIDVLETMNIKLEHSVAKLRKENETLKKHYKDLYDSIKITRSKTIEQTTSLLANNVDLLLQKMT